GFSRKLELARGKRPPSRHFERISKEVASKDRLLRQLLIFLWCCYKIQHRPMSTFKMSSSSPFGIFAQILSFAAETF
ncbi:hypothetical protein P4657_19205, partial [Halalkalibacterium halodurans]|uniref:hypothetical protein n=1 Tax=Halalkalibacterium halodurans TaxID=86665 RepID=UPI0030C8DDDC